MFKSELAVSLRQSRVEDELQGSNEVTFSDFVFTDDNDAVVGLNVNLRKIGEITNSYP